MTKSGSSTIAVRTEVNAGTDPIRSIGLRFRSARLRRESRVLACDDNTDFPALALTILVDKTENAGRGAKPLCAFIERPDRIGLGQPLHESLNQKIGHPAAGICGIGALRAKAARRRLTFARFHLRQFEAARLKRGTSAFWAGTEHVHLARKTSRL